jgi:hypothetical protein
MLHIAPAEWFWVVVNGGSVILTAWAVRDARQKYQAVRILNGRAREIVAAGNIRRETLRLLTQILLLAIVIPGLFVDRPVTLWSEAGINWGLIALVLVPVPILVNSLVDAVDRHRLVSQVERDIAEGHPKRRGTDE